MKTIVVLVVGIVLISVLFCPMAMAGRPTVIPSDIQILQPDPSLPKELSAFFGKWEGKTWGADYFLIVEKIDQEKVSFSIWRDGRVEDIVPLGWQRYESEVIKERGKYKLWWRGPLGNYELALKGEYLEMDYLPRWSIRFIRVP